MKDRILSRWLYKDSIAETQQITSIKRMEYLRSDCEERLRLAIESYGLNDVQRLNKGCRVRNVETERIKT